MAATGVTATIVHFGLIWYYFYIYYNYIVTLEPFMRPFRPDVYGGQWKFLTFWVLILQLFYFFWCCITDLVTASAPKSSIGKSAVAIRDWLLAAIVFPIGAIVVTTFWAIYSIDRELIFPEKLDQFFPSWLNHALHTFVLPLLLVDMLLVKHKYPSRVTGIVCTISFSLCYLVWVLYLGFVKDIWVYPFFKVLEGPYFILFFAVMSLVLVFFYIIGEKLSNFLGGSRKEVSTQKLD